MILLDTSGLLAAMFPDQPGHDAARDLLMRSDDRLVLSPFILAELDFMVLRFAGVTSQLALLDEVADGAYELVGFSSEDVARAAAVAGRYPSLEIGLADASLVVLSERFGTLDLLTRDHRHFRTVPGAGGEPFRILPDDLED